MRTSRVPFAAAVLALVFRGVPALAADYYVSNGGDDASSGLSVAQAFRTIQKGADVAGAGDTVHVQAGSYAEAVRLRNSGTPGAPVTFVGEGGVVMDSGHEGCPAGGSISPAARRLAILGYGIHDIVVDGFEVTGYCAYGVVFQFSDDVTIRNLHVHHNGDTLINAEGNGIAVQAGRNLLLENNVATDNASRNRFSGTGIAVAGTDQVVVRNNTADRNNGNGFLLEDVTNALFEGNRARYNIGDVHSWGTAGVWVDGGHTIVVRGNWFEGNAWDGLEITDETPSDPYGYEISNNVSVGNWYGIWLDAIGQAGQPLNLVFGNTFVDNTVAGMKLVARATSPLTHTRVYGNIVAQLEQDAPALEIDTGSRPDVVLDHNLYFRRGSAAPVRWGFDYGAPFDTTPRSSFDVSFAEYQALSGWDASSVIADPLFRDAAAGDYHLLPGSPAIDAAPVPFGVSDDYDGHARPVGAAPDLGACEGSGPCDAGVCAPGTPEATSHDSSLRPSRPVTVTLPTGVASATRVMKVVVRNGDVSPRDFFGHRMQLLASDGDCPAGTITGVPAFRYQARRWPESSELMAGGRSLPARVLLTVAADAFAGVSHCTLQFTVRATEAGNVDPLPANDSIGVELNVRRP